MCFYVVFLLGKMCITNFGVKKKAYINMNYFTKNRIIITIIIIVKVYNLLDEKTLKFALRLPINKY